MAPIELELPTLSATSKRGRVFKSDARRLARKLKNLKHSAEVVYLDPPYNQHQYGSNYHILNTIALGDRPAVNKNFWIDGKKVNKSAIRKDWTQTRSSFCYKQTALADFKDLIQTVRAKYILVSYSTEGIIDFKSMLGVLAEKGKLSVATHNYVRFRGGRQTNVTKKLNVEFILIVETGARSTARDLAEVEAKVGQANCINYFNDFFPIQKPSKTYKVLHHEEGYELLFTKENKSLWLDKKLHLCPKSRAYLSAKSSGETATPKISACISAYIGASIPQTNEERIYWMADLIIKRYDIDTGYFLGELLRLYKKLLGDANQTEALCRSRETIRQALLSISTEEKQEKQKKPKKQSTERLLKRTTVLERFPALYKKVRELTFVLETAT